MAILKPNKTTTLGGVTVNEYLLTNHNPNNIDMPSVSMEDKIIGLLFTIPIGLQLRQELLLRNNTPEQRSTAT